MRRAPDSPMPLPEPCPREYAGLGAAPCVLKPDVVFFDEMIPRSAQWEAGQLTAGADLVLVAGTSCEVYPAADIPWQVRRQGGRIIEINLEPAAELQADLVLQGRFSQLMTALRSRWNNLRN
jgi:NAD-dependent deacetylase